VCVCFCGGFLHCDVIISHRRKEIASEKLIRAIFLATAKTTKDIDRAFVKRPAVLGECRNLEILIGEIRPSVVQEVESVEVSEVGHFVPATEDVHLITEHGSTETASGLGFCAASERCDVTPGMCVEVELPQIIQILVARVTSEDIHAVLVQAGSVRSALRGLRTLGLDLSPSVSVEVVLEHVIEPSLGETVPSTESNHAVLPDDGSEGRSWAESLALSLNDNALTSSDVIAEDIISVVAAIVTSHEIEGVIVNHTLVLCLSSHSVCELGPFASVEVKFVEISFDVAYEVTLMLSNMTTVHV